MHKFKLKAEFTVETALVFPIVFWVIISLFYMTFYLHDTTVISAWAYKSGLDSTVGDTNLHSTAKSNYEKVNTFCIQNTGILTDKNDNNLVQGVGRYRAPFTVTSLLVSGERVIEEQRAIPTMNINNMVLFKVAIDNVNAVMN